MNASTTDRSKYGAVETNGLVDPSSYYSVDRSETVLLEDPRLAQVTRLRLITDPDFPFWDLSYCHGRLHDGTEVRVHLPEWQFRKRDLKAHLLEMCKSVGVYGKGLGIFDALSQVYP